jgi:hypothetical protein
MTLTLRRTLKRLALILTLGAAGLAVATEAVPAAHAYSLYHPPAITTSTYDFSTDHGSGAVLDVQGAHFSPSGSVTIEVFDSSYTLAAVRTITASPPVCGIYCIFGSGGAFYQGFEFLFYPRFQTDHVIARDNTTGVWSNWSSVYVA